MINKIKKLIQMFKNLYTLSDELLVVKDLLVETNRILENKDETNPLNRSQLSFFSQSDEDGITLEILKRLNIKYGKFLELGVGDGLENNTLVLLSQGWKGVWLGNEELAFKQGSNWKNFYYNKLWINKDNIIYEIEQSLKRLSINIDDLDLISLDLGGNDYVFIEQILNNSQPKIFIAEYNPKFPPGSEFYIEYDQGHIWKGDDYYGSSLSGLVNLFKNHGYTLVSCNSFTGANAFFIKDKYIDEKFSDIPKDIFQLYRKPRYVLPSRLTHKRSGKTIHRIIEIKNMVI